MSEVAEPGPRSRVRRRPDRARYDEASLFAVLDAHVLAHVGYVEDGQPYVTPTTYWREGRRLFWHGAAASRMLARSASGAPVCLTVSFLDGLILARSGFVHSAAYRSAMVFGRARLITQEAAKRAAMDAFLERLYPGRTAELRPASAAELAQMAVAEMTIEEASVKSRDQQPKPYPADEGWPAWRGIIPVELRLGAPEPDPAMPPRAIGWDLSPYAAGGRLDEALLAAAHSGLPVST
jgi:uncharacterized protein